MWCSLRSPSVSFFWVVNRQQNLRLFPPPPAPLLPPSWTPPLLPSPALPPLCCPAFPPSSTCCDLPQVPAAILQINVQPCGVGQVPTQDGNECIACPSSTYSFDPASGACKPCPAQGTCSGGATLVPQQQYWHSAPDSDHIVTCPNSNACAGDTSALLACQNATYQAQLDVSQVRMPSQDPFLRAL